MKLTDEQKKAIKILKERWTTVGEPQSLIGGDGCVMVSVSSDSTGVKMNLGVETDGHTHS